MLTTVSSESSAYLAAVNSVNQTVHGLQLETFDLLGANGGYPAGWIYEPGNEFPGARGGLSLVPGEASSSLAANLQADLNCGKTTIEATNSSNCGRYVAMSRKLGSLYATPTPDTAMVSMKVQVSHPLLNTSLRVVDATGQTLQLAYTAHNLETASGANWANVVVPIGTATNRWGGANDGVLHGGITYMALLASTPGLSAPPATIKVDSVRLQDDGSSYFGLSRQAPVLTSGVIPSMNGRLAISTHFYQMSDKALSQAASVGISTARLDMFWKFVESGGRFDFTYYDTLLKQFAKHGMSAVFILDYGHPDHGGGAPIAAADRAAYAEFARQAALFAKGRNVVGFEVWNEPDHPKYWTDGNPETYAQALVAARKAIKSVDPTRKVFNGGSSWVNLPYILRLAKAGELSALDGFAIHPYRPWGPETFATDMQAIKAVLTSQGVTKPAIWATEWGYSSYGMFDEAVYGNGHDPRARNRQATQVLRTVLTGTALNLPLLTLYELNDSGATANNGEENFGLLDLNSNPKPAFNALKTLSSFTKTRNYVGLLKDVPANVHALRWDGGDDSVFAVWVDANSVSLTLTLPKSATVTSWSGASVGVAATGNAATSQLKLKETDGPVFIRIPATVTQ